MIASPNAEQITRAKFSGHKHSELPSFSETWEKSTPKTVRWFSTQGRARLMNLRTVSLYVLRALAQHHIRGNLSNLESLTSEIGVRKGDVRAAVTALHKQGFVDVLRMRLTLQGFAIGRSLIGKKLPELRPHAELGSLVSAKSPAIFIEKSGAIAA